MAESNEPRPKAVLLVDGLLVAGVLLLVVLLGCFRQIDADIWWHLRTGRMILERGEIPRKDWFTFTAAERDWINLHWLFQVAAAKLHEFGGMPLLTLTSAALGTVAVAVLLAARRSEWSVPGSLACWLPALFLLSGRLYVRPEIVTLVFLAIYWTVLFHAQRRPWLFWTLPAVQLVWVNVQGLFIFGPVLLAFWWIDLGLRRIARQPATASRHAVLATLAVAVACLANPYRLRGALFPFVLFRKMSHEHEFYGQHIGELQSVSSFIAEHGLDNPYLLLHLTLLVAGAVSFALPLLTRQWSWFRLLAFGAFGWLSLQATRNSGQFALVAGAVLAGNVGEWLSARRGRRTRIGGTRIEDRGSRIAPTDSDVRHDASDSKPSILHPLSSMLNPLSLLGRLALAVTLLLAIWSVVSGRFYDWAAEGRLFGLDEQPLWHAHDAARFAARPGMSQHVLAFHEGQAAVLEFHMRPDQRVFADPRLEVMPRELMEDYYDLARAIALDRADWRARLRRLPVALTILAAHRSHIDLEATLLADPNWRCVFFDPVAGVFLPRRKAEQAGIAEVDFGARHFQPRRAVPELITGDLDGPAKPLAPQPPAAEAAALLKIAEVLATRPGHDAQARSIVLVAMDRAREAAWSQPQSIAGWRALGLASWSLARLSSAAGSQPGPAGDWAPSEMLDLARARYFLGRAHELDRSDFAVLLALFHTAVAQNDRDAQIEFGKRLRLRGARDARERPQLQLVRERLADLQAPDSAAELPPPVASSLQELTVRTDRRLADGQIAHAVAEFAGFVRVHGPLPWMLADRYAGLLMRQGDPSAARDVWQHQVLGDCDEGQRLERIASTYLVEGDSEAAIASYRTALRLSPTCGDARWGLARVYLECGDAAAVAEQYHDALDNPAISPAVRNQLQWMRELAEPYAVPKLEDPASREGD